MFHKEFPRTIPEWRGDDARIVIGQYNSIRGDQWNESDQGFKEPVKDFKRADQEFKEQSQGFQESDKEFKEPVKEFKGARGEPPGGAVGLLRLPCWLGMARDRPGGVWRQTGQLTQDSTWRGSGTGATQMTILNSFWSPLGLCKCVKCKMYINHT